MDQHPGLGHTIDLQHGLPKPGDASIEAAQPAGGSAPPLRLTAISVRQRLLHARNHASTSTSTSTSDHSSQPRFHVEGVIGMGGTSEVFAVHDQDLDRDVVIKMLRAELMDQDQCVAEFFAEASMTARLAHPNVLPVLDLSIAEDGRPYFSMHRIQGRTLAQLLEQPGGAAADGSFNRTVSILIAVCQAVAYGHARGIIHQDIKPENILLGDFGEVLLLDWGSARQLDQQGRVQEKLYGTPLYMSPEQARRSYADVRSDVYAIGATLFHVLVGRVPIWNEDVDRFWEAKRLGEHDPLLDSERLGCPAELLDIALKAVAADPLRRYASVALMRDDLEKYQAGQAVSAHRYSLTSQIWRWCRSHRTLVASLLVCSLAVLACFLLAWRQQRLQSRSWHLDTATPFSSMENAAKDWTGHHLHGWKGSMEATNGLPGEMFSVHDGWLSFGSKTDIVDLSFSREPLGNIRIEWDYRSLTTGNNLNCFIDGHDRFSGFTFHVGGWGVPTSCVLTHGEQLHQLAFTTMAEPLNPQVSHHFIMERADRHVRLSIDGTQLIDYLDPENIGGSGSQGFGFDSYLGSLLAVRDVRVYRQPLAQLLSPLEVADKLYQLRLWNDAEKQYRELASAYPGSELATSASFRAALCCKREMRLPEADGLFAAFIHEHPDHELSPYALGERLDIAKTQKDQAEIDHLRMDLAAFHRHPVQIGVLWDLTEEFKARQPNREQCLQDPAGACRELTHLTKDYLEWTRRYDQMPIANDYWGALSAHLLIIGRPDILLELLPPGNTYRAQGLIEQGLIDQAHREFPLEVKPIWLSGHQKDLLDARFNPAEQSNALLELGDSQVLHRDYSWSEACSLLDAAQGGADAYLERHPLTAVEADFGSTTRTSILMHLKRYQQILAEYTHVCARARAHLALGQEHDALTEAPFDPCIPGLAAVRSIAQGDPRHALQVLADSPVPWTGEVERLFDIYITPALVQVANGDLAAARAVISKMLEHRDCYQQRSWYLGRYILGSISDQEFLSQPVQLGIQERLLTAQALRCEIRGDVQGARARYREIVQVPDWQRDYREVFYAWITFRLNQVGEQPPLWWDLLLLEPFE